MMETILSFVLAVMPGVAWQKMLLLGVGGTAGDVGGIAWVGSTANDAYNNTPTGISSGAVTVSSGNLIVVGCGSRTTIASVPTDTQGNTYSLITSASETAVGTYSYLYSAAANSGGSLTITCNQNSTGIVFIGVSVISGQNASPNDGNGNAIDFNSGNATLATSSFTPTNTGSVAIACSMSYDNGHTFTAGTGYTLAAASSGSGNVGRCQYKLSTGTSSQTASMTWSPNSVSKCITVGVFKP